MNRWQRRLLIAFLVTCGCFWKNAVGFLPCLPGCHIARRIPLVPADSCLHLHPKGFGTSSATKLRKFKPQKQKNGKRVSPSKSSTSSPPFVESYQPPSHWITHGSLAFDIQSAQSVLVLANLTVEANHDLIGDTSIADLVLDGDASRLELRSVKLVTSDDGKPRLLQPNQDYFLTDTALTIENLPTKDSFILQTIVHVTPGTKELSGLYHRDDMLATHCEPTGFSRITYWLDRPDVTTIFDAVRLQASRVDFPLLLSNGKCIEEGPCDGEDDRHYVVYQDPHPKPCYIFALVAARHLQQCAEGSYTTSSGRRVHLQIYSEPAAGNGRLQFALETLQRAMAWDEATYGVEYDLDEYRVVATSHFHIGAMENKGLNLFQTSLIVTHPNITTDVTYDLVEKTVAHEFFHDQTGNRVTVQSWREFGLKEGLTVFRDQEFMADVGLRTTVRIEAVKILREKQFREDASPEIRHAVRPELLDSQTLDSLASSTTYHKGAEVCRMFQTVLGKVGFLRGLQLYLNRHDGSSASWDDFRNAMADATETNLDQLGLWYSIAGTPTVSYCYSYDAERRKFSLTLKQNLECKPDVFLHIPVAIGLLDKTTGQELLPTTVLNLKSRGATFDFDDLPKEVVPSVLRDFSAPVVLVSENMSQHEHDLAFLATYDTDGFNRWEAIQRLYTVCIFSILREEDSAAVQKSVIEAFGHTLKDPNIDAASKSYLLNLPTESVLSRQLEMENPVGVHGARLELGRRIRSHFETDIQSLYDELTLAMPVDARTDTLSRATRSLRNVLLEYLCFVGESSEDQLKAAHLAMTHYDTATCLTDRIAAFRKLSSMSGVAAGLRDEAVDKFYQYAKQNGPMVMNKWFQTQALSDLPDVLDRVQRLTQHPDFKATNAGRFRSLITSFTFNAKAFHTEYGYQFIGSVISQMDKVAPPLSVELTNKLASWRRHPPERATLMKTELQRIASAKNLSPSLSAAVKRALAKK